MQINQRVLESIFHNISDVPPFENGGILGSIDGIITVAIADNGHSNTCGCSYEPNVEMFNQIISEWQKEDIEFSGIYHTHFFGVETLSQGDIDYINLILSAMPEQITQLYFPVVLPEKQQMIPYLAEKTAGGIRIVKDSLNVIEE